MSPYHGRTIAWQLLIPAEVKCEYTEIPQGDYYTDLERCLEVSRRFPERFQAVTGYRPPLTYTVPVTAYEGVRALGGELVFPRDHQPMIRNQGRVLNTPEQIDALEVPDPWQDARFQRRVRWRRELQARYGERVAGGLAGQEGPVTTAVLLRGQDFFLDCLVDPSRAHRLMRVCTDMFIRWHLAAMEVDGRSPDVASVCDDHSGLLGPDLWPEFVLPYYERIIEALGPNGCWMHSELLRPAHLPLLRDLGLICINLAENQYLTIQDVADGLPCVPFGWHILTVQEMREGTPELIKRRYREIVDQDVDEVRCELTVGTPPENIRAFLDVARRFE